MNDPLDEDFRKAGFSAAARAHPRSDLAFKMLCAFNGLTPAQAPPAWGFHANPAMQQAWERVEAVVRAELDQEAVLRAIQIAAAAALEGELDKASSLKAIERRARAALRTAHPVDNHGQAG